MSNKNKNTNYDDKTIVSFGSSVNTSKKDSVDKFSYNSSKSKDTQKNENIDKVIKEYDDESIASFGSANIQALVSFVQAFFKKHIVY
jgi:uncharacterized protein YaaN involved in tellurite resistance